ncbi:unnamed protein product [Psylliodes chrysocephalus]|uniref:MADF domain-containing protein n=1 Tax=Psylliodes chrysocephalus TaxID=3402493 RepID=A0A9P0GF15_9CUCU|nr:unnamed protein product [Psylliodes chrysocephala]
MWKLIAHEISNLYKITIGPEKCENKWKVVDRSYKKFVDNNRKTGRGRKKFEFEAELDIIYGKKENIMPRILLTSTQVLRKAQSSSETHSTPLESFEPAIKNLISVEETALEAETRNVALHQTQNPSRKRSKRNITPAYKKQNEILIDIKNDLKNHYTEKTG